MRSVHLVAHNIRSAENVGSLFRTADSLGISKLWLCGYTPGPDHPKVKKTALGAERMVEFERRLDVLDLFQTLKFEAFTILGLELDDRAKDLATYQSTDSAIALVLGNEVEGLPLYVREACDTLLFIPQKGSKESLNVSVAAGIACWRLLVDIH